MEITVIKKTENSESNLNGVFGTECGKYFKAV